jgi:FG-GAP-like repeat
MPRYLSPLSGRLLRLGAAVALLTAAFVLVGPALAAISMPAFIYRYYGAPGTSGVAAMGDMDGDGSLDIVNGNGLVYLNDGAGNYFSGAVDCSAPPANVRCFGSPGSSHPSIAAADVNGDGALDIVTGLGQIYLNNGHGNFYSGTVSCALANVRCFGSPGYWAYGLALGDMNNDGALDIVSTDGHVYWNNGWGSFYTGAVDCAAVPALANVRCFSASGSFAVAVADLNSDGALDIVSSTGYVFLNDGSGNFFSGTVTCAPAPANVRCLGGVYRSLAIGDMNGDRVLDIFAGGNSLQSALFLNDGFANFTSAGRPGALGQ